MLTGASPKRAPIRGRILSGDRLSRSHRGDSRFRTSYDLPLEARLRETTEPGAGGRRSDAARFVFRAQRARSTGICGRPNGPSSRGAARGCRPPDSTAACHRGPPAEYGQGDIPRASTARCPFAMWDRGTFAAEKFRANEGSPRSARSRAGPLALFQTRGRTGDHRMARRSTPLQPMPERLTPMRAKSGRPRAKEWASRQVAVSHALLRPLHSSCCRTAPIHATYPKVRELPSSWAPGGRPPTRIAPSTSRAAELSIASVTMHLGSPRRSTPHARHPAT